jgi:hypothetical protein
MDDDYRRTYTVEAGNPLPLEIRTSMVFQSQDGRKSSVVDVLRNEAGPSLAAQGIHVPMPSKCIVERYAGDVLASRQHITVKDFVPNGPPPSRDLFLWPALGPAEGAPLSVSGEVVASPPRWDGRRFVAQP